MGVQGAKHDGWVFKGLCLYKICGVTHSTTYCCCFAAAPSSGSCSVKSHAWPENLDIRKKHVAVSASEFSWSQSQFTLNLNRPGT